MISEKVKECYLAIKKEMDNSDDKHAEYVLDDSDLELFKSYRIFENGDWDDEGKYQYSTDVFEITTNEDEKFLMQVVTSRSGSYFSDYYYNIEEVIMVTHEKKEITKVVDVYTEVKI